MSAIMSVIAPRGIFDPALLGRSRKRRTATLLATTFLWTLTCCAATARAAEEMSEADAIEKLNAMGATLLPAPLSQDEYRKTRRQRPRGRPSTEAPRPIARVQLAGERFGDQHLKLLKHIPMLDSLLISNTSVTDAGLSELKALRRLNTLTINGPIAHSRLTDSGVKQLSDISTLTQLYLSEVRVTDEGMTSVAKLHNLEKLSIRAAEVTDACIKHISTLQKLKVLAVGGLGITDEGMRTISELPALEDLGVSESSISDHGLDLFRRLPKLTSLHVRSDQFSERAIGRLKGMLALKILSIGGASINDTSLADLAGLPSLESLDISYNPGISDAGLKHLLPLKKLASLGLHHTSITNDGLPWLTALPNLKHLNLSATAVSDAGLEALKPIKSLRDLVVPNVVTDAAIERFRAETRINVLGR